MKMHHLDKEKVQAVMGKIRELGGGRQLSTEQVEELFNLSGMEGSKFIECKNNPLQAEKVNFEIDPEKGVRFLDPFNFYTCGVYKDVDGWTVWTTDNLKEPWSY